MFSSSFFHDEERADQPASTKGLIRANPPQNTPTNNAAILTLPWFVRTFSTRNNRAFFFNFSDEDIDSSAPAKGDAHMLPSSLICSDGVGLVSTIREDSAS